VITIRVPVGDITLAVESLVLQSSTGPTRPVEMLGLEIDVAAIRHTPVAKLLSHDATPGVHERCVRGVRKRPCWLLGVTLMLLDVITLARIHLRMCKRRHDLTV